jgi:uncharacterized membrane protein
MRERDLLDDSHKLIAAIGIGAIAGLRSMTAPAVVTWAANQGWIQSPTRRLAFLQNRTTVSIISVLAVGELVLDKLPSTPNRTEPFGLAIRFLTGGLSAGAVCAPKKKLVAAGAVVGGLAAIAGAFIGYETRRRLREKLHLSDMPIAIAEDALAVGGGILLVHRL